MTAYGNGSTRETTHRADRMRMNFGNGTLAYPFRSEPLPPFPLVMAGGGEARTVVAGREPSATGHAEETGGHERT